jgi:hypothetical protein
LFQAANTGSPSEREASVLHLARQALFEPSGARNTADDQVSSLHHLANPRDGPTMLMLVDDLAAELFAIMLTDNEADPDSHSKLWVSRSEVQREKGGPYPSEDTTADDTQ